MAHQLNQSHPGAARCMALPGLLLLLCLLLGALAGHCRQLQLAAHARHGAAGPAHPGCCCCCGCCRRLCLPLLVVHLCLQQLLALRGLAHS
jgi:hypothetical protein